MSNPASEQAAKVADMIDLLKRKQRTVDELAELTELHRSTVAMWLETFEKFEHARITGCRKSGRAVARLWGWVQ